MKKVAWVFILIIVISGIYLGLQHFNYSVPDKYNAMIIHKELLPPVSNNGNTAETVIIYKYYFYREKNNTYKYIKTKAKDSFMGEGKASKVKTGKVKSQDDINKISEDMDKDYKAVDNSKKTLEFKFVDGGSSRNCSSLKALFEKMFPKT